MATQGIVAATQPFVKSLLPSRLKAIVQKRVKEHVGNPSSVPYTYQNYLQSLDSVLAKLENQKTFSTEKRLRSALKDVQPKQGGVSNKELTKVLLEQEHLQRIFTKISKSGTVALLKRNELEFIMQHPAESVRGFVKKYQRQLEEALEMRYNEEIDINIETYLLSSLIKIR